jgi:hypothetical protein
MAAGQRSRVTIETERILIIARHHAVVGWCERCGAEVQLLRSGHAANALQGVPEPWGQQLSGKAHLSHAKDGLVICLRSLLRFLQAKT